MFQTVIALVFLAMIATPAIIAANSGKKEAEPEHDEVEVEVAAPALRRQRNSRPAPGAMQHAPATLPMRGTLGMANR